MVNIIKVEISLVLHLDSVGFFWKNNLIQPSDQLRLMCNCIKYWFFKLKEILAISSYSIYGFSEMKGCIIITLNSSLIWFSAKLYFYAPWLVYHLDSPLLFQNNSATDAILPCLQSRGGRGWVVVEVVTFGFLKIKPNLGHLS